MSNGPTVKRSRIDQMREILRHGGAEIDGMFVGGFDASAYVLIYDNLSSVNQERLEDTPLLRAMNKVWYLYEKAKVEV